MQVVIYGAGAVGLGLASALAAGGARIRLVARPATVEALRAHGLHRVGVLGEHRVPAADLEVAASLVELDPAPAQAILVATKSFDAADAAEALAADRRIRSPSTDVVLCQNGWGQAEIFARRLPREHVWNARVITGFRRLALHRVEITVHAQPMAVGSLFGADVERITPLCDAIRRGGIPCAPASDIEADLWAKVLYNGCLNPLGAVFGVPYGALGESSHGRALIDTLAHETFAAMQAAGHHTHHASADAWLDVFYRELLPATAPHESSMLQDLRAGRRTEIDALTGEVVRLAERHHVSAPVSRALLAMVRFLEERAARGQSRPV